MGPVETAGSEPNGRAQTLMEEEIVSLKSRLDHIELENRTDPGGKADSLPYRDGENDSDPLDGGGSWQTGGLPSIPKVRKLRYPEYKNRSSENDRRYAIDVLMGGPLLDQEIQQELKTREDHASRRKHNKSASSSISGPSGSGGVGVKSLSLGPGQEVSLIDKALHSAGSDDLWIQRVRIQSPALLIILARLSGETWSLRPRSFWRPFEIFIRVQDRMKEILADLELKWGASELNTPLSSRNDVPRGDAGRNQQQATLQPGNRSSPGMVDEKLPPPEAGLEPSPYVSLADDPNGDWANDNLEPNSSSGLDDSVEAMRDVRCYVQFVEKEIMPLYGQFSDKDEFSQEMGPDGYMSSSRIRFDDLWFLFRTGELVYLPVEDESADRSHVSSIRQTAWRVISKHAPLPRYKVSQQSDLHRSTSPHYGVDEEDLDFVLCCYYIDYTGDEFCIVTQNFRIRPFPGDKKIKSLEIYPIRFKLNHKELQAEFGQRGKEFLTYIDEKHFAYNWWTATCGPKGNPITDSDGNVISHPTHVNSDVIVDFVEAFQVNPSWKPQANVLKPLDSNSLTTVGEVLIREWSGSRLVAEVPEVIQLRTRVDMLERNRNLLQDKFLSSVRDNARLGQYTTAESLQPEDMCILPKRVYAYILADRKFAQLDARKLRGISGSYNGFESLKINKHHKNLIQALVESHFINKAIERQHGVEGISQDLIQGKGRGLVILLHGVPGVGKTATAEAVAQASRKPLFALSCGDLGITPKDVESALHEIFRLASIWDAILLLDEVDTFFAQRSRTDADITKNALVSVFLRVLEYYNGILFLTTNRPGQLDEAFKSRIQVSIYYPPLTEIQTKEIWEMNLERLKTIEDQRSKSTKEQPLQVFEPEIMAFAMDHYYKHKQSKRWNGRQIKNAFQIAASLAYYDMRAKYHRQLEQDPDAQPSRPVLGSEHFRTVDRLTSNFDEYMLETLGHTDAELAHQDGARFDDHEDGPWPSPDGGVERGSSSVWGGPGVSRRETAGHSHGTGERHGDIDRDRDKERERDRERDRDRSGTWGWNASTDPYQSGADSPLGHHQYAHSPGPGPTMGHHGHHGVSYRDHQSHHRDQGGRHGSGGGSSLLMAGGRHQSFGLGAQQGFLSTHSPPQHHNNQQRHGRAPTYRDGGPPHSGDYPPSGVDHPGHGHGPQSQRGGGRFNTYSSGGNPSQSVDDFPSFRDGARTQSFERSPPPPRSSVGEFDIGRASVQAGGVGKNTRDEDTE